MTQDRNKFGLTTQQTGFLVGLGVIACLLFGVTGALAAGRGLSGLFAGLQEGTPTAQPTSTATLIPVAAITDTPTPIPYEQLIPTGWVQYRTALIEIWLPTGYKPAASASVATVAGNTIFLEMAVISSQASAGYKSNVSVAYEFLLTNTIEEFIDLKVSRLPLDVNLAERRKISVNATEAYRLLFERHGANNLTTNDLVYVFQDGSTVWYVQYSAEIVEFYEKLSLFEQSSKTFRIAP